MTGNSESVFQIGGPNFTRKPVGNHWAVRTLRIGLPENHIFDSPLWFQFIAFNYLMFVSRIDFSSLSE